MENASKALLLSAGVLLGLMIISVAVALFSSFGNSGAEVVEQIEKAKIAEFNNQFLKYWETYSRGKEGSEFAGVTAHDIVTIVNLAEKNNEENELTDQPSGNGKTNYIQVDFKGIKNIEKKTVRERTGYEPLTKLIQNSKKLEYVTYGEDGVERLIKQYYIENIEVSSITGRVYHVVIKEK